MDNMIYIEDSRKYKKLSLTLSIICFILFLSLFITGILHLINIIPNLTDGKSFIPVSIIFLFISIYTLWVSFSKHLKQYMYISSNEIKFCIDNVEKVFSNSDILSFTIIKKANWLMGGYWTYEIKFNNNDIYYYKSFKKNNLEIVLNQIIN